jgi:hypothetical protein
MHILGKSYVRRGRSVVLPAATIAAAALSLWLSGAVSGRVATLSAKPSTASPYTETFGYRGQVTQTVIVPEGASSAELRAIGGKGGGTYPKSNKEGDFVTGGDGAQVSGEIAVRPGQVLKLTVAEYGGDANHNINPGKGGWGATGTGGRGGGSSTGDGAGGGGDTRVEIADCETCKSSPILVAGGGGGAGGTGFTLAFNRGGPGGSSGATVDSGHSGRGLGAGQGGSGGASGSGHGLGGGDGSNTGGAGGGGGAGLRGGDHGSIA